MADPFYYDKLMTLNQVYHNTLVSPSSVINPVFEKITTPLYPHQHSMVHGMHHYREKMVRGWMLGNQAVNGKIGILADPPGSGKTLTVLAYLASYVDTLPRLTCELTPHSSRFFYSHEMAPLSEMASANLIIVPHSLFHEWKHQIQQHTTLCHVAIETRRMLRGDALAKEMVNGAFVLTTNKCYKHVQEYAQQHHIHWNHIFLDEASSIYMSSSDPPFHFQFLWMITNQWMPLLFKNSSFNRASLYRMREELPVPLHPDLEEWLQEEPYSHSDGAAVSSGFLKDYLPFHHPHRYITVLRNPEQAIVSAMALPCIDTEMVTCRPNITFASLMNYYASRNMEPTIASSKIPYLFQSLGIAFQSVDAYCDLQLPHRHSLIQRKAVENECVICLERCDYPTILDCCYHLYCGPCLLKNTLMNGRCPTCRDPVYPQRMSCLAPLADTQRTMIKSKAETCLEWIRANPTGRFIIYSAFDNIYYQLFEEIDRMGRKTERMENNLFSMLKTVRNFKQGTTQILFVSNIDLIRGMSFPFVSHLIFYHESPIYEKKKILIQSVQRVGRTHPLKLIQLHSDLQV